MAAATPSVDQIAWVQRVLGVGKSAGPPPDIGTAAAQWRTASDLVDQQIGALQSALRSDGDEELADIAEFGLNAITGDFKVKLTAALMGAERGDESSRKVLAGVIPGFRNHLATDERVEACDDNPFGVAMSIRATLIPALDALGSSIAP